MGCASSSGGDASPLGAFVLGFGCAFGPIALCVSTPPLYLLTLLLTLVLCVLAQVLYLLTRALSPPPVLVVAVWVRGSPPLADVRTDVL